MARVKAFQSAIQKHKRIGIDSSIFIYQFEENKKFSPLCSVIFDLLSEGKIEAVASMILVSEILVRPFEKKDIEVVSLYENVFETLPHFSLIEVDYKISQIAAHLRGEYDIQFADAIHIACAIRKNANAFVTNDVRLQKVKDIEVLCLKEYL